jgi:hypothetical protein
MKKTTPPIDELDARLRALEAERIRPVPKDWHACGSVEDRWGTPRARREALAAAIGTTDTYVPED